MGLWRCNGAGAASDHRGHNQRSRRGAMRHHTLRHGGRYDLRTVSPAVAQCNLVSVTPPLSPLAFLSLRPRLLGS